MIIVCPNCGFERDVPSTAIPASATKVTCPRCNVKFTFREFIKEMPKAEDMAIHEEDDNVRVDISKEGVDKSEHFQEDIEFREKEIHKAEERNTQNDYFDEESNDETRKLSPEEEDMLRKAHEAYREQLQKIENLKKQGYVLQALSMVPWESTSTDKNILQKFFQTIVQVLFSAPAFFATMFRPFPMTKAVFFYLLLGLLQFASRYIAFIMTDTMNLPAGGDVATGATTLDVIALMRDPSFITLTVALAPMLLFIQYMGLTIVLFAVVKLIHPERADFNHIGRIIAYASSPVILSVIPMIGDMIALPWTLYNIIIACRFGLHLSLGKTALAVGAFSLFCMVLLSAFAGLVLPVAM